MFRRPEFKELLDNIVAENVSHKVVGGGYDLIKYKIFLGQRGALELLLDKSGPVLILRELHHMPSQISQCQVWKTIIPKN